MANNMDTTPSPGFPEANPPILPQTHTDTTQTSLTVSLHPLVVMNVSDHYTRASAQRNGLNTRVFGAILGSQKGRHVELFNSFELNTICMDNGEFELNKDYLVEKDTMFKQVYPDLDVIGWYTNGPTSQAEESEMQFHKQIIEWNMCPLLLKLININPNIVHNQLPVIIYEANIDTANQTTNITFSEVNFSLASEEAERIGVDHVARVSVSGSDNTSAVSNYLLAQYQAIKMLYSRVRLTCSYLEAVKSKELEPNQETLRDIQSLARQLPVIQTPDMLNESLTQTNDVLLMSYLSSITKGTDEANNLVSKLNSIYDKQSITRKSRGLFMH